MHHTGNAAAIAKDVDLAKDVAATVTAIARDLTGSARRKKPTVVCQVDAVDKGGG